MNMENEKQNEVPVKNPIKKVGLVETYAGDMSKVIEKNEDGIIKRIIHEQEEQELVKENLSPESKKNKFFMLLGGGLIIVAILVVFFLTVFQNQISSVTPNNQINPIIFTDKTSYVEIGGLSKDQVVQTIVNEINSTKIKVSGVEGIYLTENKKTIGLRRFISILKGNFLLTPNNFVSDNFLLGVEKDDANLISASVKTATSTIATSTTILLGNNLTTNNPFILLQSRSFLDIFPSMKSWESKMFSDLHGLLGITINADNNYLLTRDFEDGFVNNKNARILYDKNGQVVLEYVFMNDASVIITNSDTVVKEIMSRLVSLQIKS